MPVPLPVLRSDASAARAPQVARRGERPSAATLCVFCRVACDRDGDGHVDYKEFVDALARDTVAPAAMGKRGMQAKEAMGVESLDKAFLGHGNAPKHAMAMKQ